MSTPGGTARYVGEAWLGFVALVTATLGLWLRLGPAAELGRALLGNALGNGVAPTLLLIALAGWGVRSRRVPAGSAAVAVALGLAAFTAGALATAAWAVGFDLADAGLPSTPFADLFLVFLGTSWLLGAASAFVALDVLFRRTTLPRPRRIGLAGLLAVFAAPAIGLSFVAPVTPVLASIAVTVLVLLAGAPGASRASARPEGAGDGGGESAGGDAAPGAHSPVGRAPAALAWLSAGLGAGAVAFALSGRHWPWLGRGLDGTTAMGWGIAAGLVGALPLLLALALVAHRRRTRHAPRWAAWAPAALLAGALLAEATFSVDTVLTAGAGSAVGWFLAAIGLLLYGLAIAVGAFARLPLAGPGRAATAALIGLGLTVLTGAALLLVAFASPVLAVVLAAVVFPRLNRPRRALGPAAPGIA
ncbi:hypothetical protein E3T54_14620 [Cryobacterium sp. Sr8]|uniref:hypothetical protein n=1 Tax=Cryobacterium sp. Sr8 TaxID=1259203 RepID=UPI00106C5ED3|nr:hypothetical protein [Cryobacterium sp. Sr8]TFD74037.1 hypothetical protein E3T54_14620 [Cryobacterium sp. Sr8]